MAMVNEPSVFEPSKFFCIYISAGAQLSRDILFHFWQKYFFHKSLNFFINCKFNISGIKV